MSLTFIWGLAFAQAPDSLFVKERFLMLNGRSSLTLNFDGEGEEKTVIVHCSAPWTVSSDIEWCSVNVYDDSLLVLGCMGNATLFSRHSFVKVQGDSLEARIAVVQASRPENALSSRNWVPLFREIVSANSVMSGPAGCYRGQVSSHSFNGMGAAYWKSSDAFCLGTWKNGQRSGFGAYVSSEDGYVSNCPGCVYYVGEFDGGIKNGEGRCYDRYGNMIYHGLFSADTPADVYPSRSGDDAYLFDCIKYSNGTIYVGEVLAGLRHGFGIIIRADGSAWFGEWEDGQRQGYGMEMPDASPFIVGRWSGDSYQGER